MVLLIVTPVYALKAQLTRLSSSPPKPVSVPLHSIQPSTSFPLLFCLCCW
ncbi:hypothetical protein Hanom_Chr06g00481511 [Helianthus anomalus]